MQKHHDIGYSKPVILLIDGECSLCHAITQFVVKRDPRGHFQFASLQSPIGQRLLQERGLPANDWNTFVMIQGEGYFTKSDAALRVLRGLRGLWPLLYSGLIVPTFLRDLVYDLIANHRYRWFGKKDVCLLLTPELRSRFIDIE
ncbi:hypothetical protein Back11_19970 [Paenibacillus baekrokdamisoli]|uniref:Uncharacterized protein n=1 Tax=Paenibacillus baekrokdamisoli TaxID=1712516 RepID=A0A3G9IQT9_9BACL|nr:DCC1-like thiol-disulfide oxidoreductase family protein [Paenibacillus baekrokdamisoli]MBB3069998.1 putative DCC family thiol-disulfide oxidoreductase YuxK [Paenibacillus baekrokdamisoli]BBH20652.1 hypothetical protein Back11_19970 [Paenibacillus baekrokdamisoli]